MGEPSPETPLSQKLPENRLDSWKEIAAYLDRDVTTVQRWEKREGMPVHRHLHDKRGSVYALGPELDEWLRSRKPYLAEEAEDKEKEQKPEAPEQSAGSHSSGATPWARGWLVLAAVGVLGLLAAAYLMSRGRTGNAGQPKIGALAVLPLKNLSGDPS